MPELPEVEATRQNLTRWTTGRRVLEVVAEGASPLGSIAGEPIGEWHRRGKRLAAEVGAGVLLVQLGMTGRIVFGAPLERPYQRVRLVLDEGAVSLIDVRRLGRVVLVGDLGAAFEGLGPDARDDAPDGPGLGRLLGRSRKGPLKAALLDQARIAGLGNIAVLEACFRAGLHPLRALDTVAEVELTALSRGIAAHLSHTLATTLGHDEIVYVSEGGGNPFLIYGRAGQPCPRCATTLQRETTAGRPTIWCPVCQPQ
jgi:formamidopyrimidine-DNA glycosylase